MLVSRISDDMVMLDERAGFQSVWRFDCTAGARVEKAEVRGGGRRSARVEVTKGEGKTEEKRWVRW